MTINPYAISFHPALVPDGTAPDANATLGALSSGE
jgi:hypothetical protein